MNSTTFHRACQLWNSGRSHYNVTIPFSEDNGVSLSPDPYDPIPLRDIGVARIFDEEYQNGGNCQGNSWKSGGQRNP
jgi:hypothetical protein